MADTQSLDHRELERRSQDRLRVLNPTEADYHVKWDGYLHKIPAHGEAIFPRYIAEKYMKEHTQEILTARQDKAVKLENEKRKEAGKPEMDKWQGGDQQIFEDQFRFREGVNNPEAVKAVMKSLFGGIVEEYGLDVREEIAPVVNRDSMDDILGEIQSETPIVEPIQSEPQETLEDKSVFELQKVAREKGVEYQKTDKKDDLIAKISQ